MEATSKAMIATIENAPVTVSPASRSAIIDSLMGTVSASRLNLFHSCRLKFWFKYVEQIEKPKTAALHVGGSVHGVLKVWNKARWMNQVLTLKQLHTLYTGIWRAEGDEPIKWQEGEEAEEKAVGWRLLETYLRESNIPPDSKPEAVEVPVEVNLDHHGLPKLVGILDLVQAE